MRCCKLFSILVELLLANKLVGLRSRADRCGLIDGHGNGQLFLCKLCKRAEAEGTGGLAGVGWPNHEGFVWEGEGCEIDCAFSRERAGPCHAHSILLIM